MTTHEFLTTHDDTGDRIDMKVAGLTGMSRARVQDLIEADLVTVNGKAVKQNYRLNNGDNIRIEIPNEEGSEELVPEDLPLTVLHRDEFLAVVDKPSGMVVYPAAGHAKGTLMNALAYRCGKLASIGGPLRPGVVHRLDKDTSGIMVIALEDRAYYDLVEQFRDRTIHRQYLALIYGGLKEDAGAIALKIGRAENDRKKMSTKSKRGKEAVTNWKVLERFPGASLIEAKLGTGRTHQIRVHFASIGHPVLGDRTYGNKTSLEINRRKILFPRQMLHAELLGFRHPKTGEYLEFRSGLPGDMEQVLNSLRTVTEPHGFRL